MDLEALHYFKLSKVIFGQSEPRGGIKSSSHDADINAITRSYLLNRQKVYNLTKQMFFFHELNPFWNKHQSDWEMGGYPSLSHVMQTWKHVHHSRDVAAFWHVWQLSTVWPQHPGSCPKQDEDREEGEDEEVVKDDGHNKALDAVNPKKNQYMNILIQLYRVDYSII